MKMFNNDMTMTQATEQVETAFDEFRAERGYEPKASADRVAELLYKVIRMNVRVELIGSWLYVFDSYHVKDDLKELGFWFSKKHKAWIYSGSPKKRFRSKLTTDDVRARHGSEVIRERETVEA